MCDEEKLGFRKTYSGYGKLMISVILYLSNERVCDDDEPSTKEGSCSAQPDDPVGNEKVERWLNNDQRQFTDGLGEVVG